MRPLEIGTKDVYRAKIKTYSKTPRDRSFCFIDIYRVGASGELVFVADHMWVDQNRKHELSNANVGDVIWFRGKPRSYKRSDGSMDRTLLILKVLSVEQEQNV